MMPSPLVTGNRLYTMSDGGIACCFDAGTGEEKWRARIDGRYSSSPICADGRIYIANHAGLTTVFPASDEFEKLAENRLDGQLMASPVPVDGSLLLRTGTHLYRVGK
jgi:hypothetical protein